MTPGEIVALIGVVAGFVLNAIGVAFGAGVLSNSVKNLDLRLGIMQNQWDTRMTQVLSAIEKLHAQSSEHETRLAVVEDRVFALHHHHRTEDDAL